LKSPARQFKFIGDCARLIRADEAYHEKIVRMVHQARTKTFGAMRRQCKLPANHLVEVSPDPDTKYFQSIFDGVACWFYQYAGFEFIWVEETYPLSEAMFVD